jgi:hypothetical protein
LSTVVTKFAGSIAWVYGWPSTTSAGFRAKALGLGGAGGGAEVVVAGDVAGGLDVALVAPDGDVADPVAPAAGLPSLDPHAATRMANATIDVAIGDRMGVAAFLPIGDASCWRSGSA